MKLLFSIPWFFPAYKAGGPVRSMLNLVKAIENDSEISIITGDTDLNEVKFLEGIEIDKWENFGDSKVFYTSSKMNFLKRIKLLRRIQADILFTNGIYSFHFTILPILFSKYENVIISARGMLHEQALHQKKWKKKLYLIFLRSLVKIYGIEFHATDNKEADYIKKAMGDHVNIWIAPNFPSTIPITQNPKPKHKLHLLTVALVGPMKNYKFILDALMFVEGEVEYDICGPLYFPDYWDECLSVIERLPSNIKVNYHGSIQPSQLQRFYQNAHVFICPSQSENYGHSFFEALSCGCPVISSYNTPWLGLYESKAGMNVKIDKQEIAKSIQFFMDMDVHEYQIWSESAIKFAFDSFDFETTKSMYKKMFRI